MGWERKIPFGYRMEQTKIICEEAEAEAIRRIFEYYLEGESMAQIAQTMSGCDVRYHAHTAVWNKNMIKRIIEDDRYLGNEDYPGIIDRKTFLSVRLMREEKAQPASPCPEPLKSLRNKIICPACGARMLRHPSRRKKTRWICANDDCRQTAIIQDEIFMKEIEQCLKKLLLSPELMKAPELQQPIISLDTLRLKNELTAAFNRGTESSEYMKRLIFALAAERYNALADMTAEYEMNKLRRQIEEHEIDMDTLIKKAVRRILLHRSAGVSIELINGVTIASEKEETQ